MNQRKVKALKKMYREQTGKASTRPQFKAFVKLLKKKRLFNLPLYEGSSHQKKSIRDIKI